MDRAKMKGKMKTSYLVDAKSSTYSLSPCTYTCEAGLRTTFMDSGKWGLGRLSSLLSHTSREEADLFGPTLCVLPTKSCCRYLLLQRKALTQCNSRFKGDKMRQRKPEGARGGAWGHTRPITGCLRHSDCGGSQPLPQQRTVWNSPSVCCLGACPLEEGWGGLCTISLGRQFRRQ